MAHTDWRVMLRLHWFDFWKPDKSTTCSQQIEPLQQLHDKLYNKSLSSPQQFDNPKRVYDKSTTIQQVERLESENDKK